MEIAERIDKGLHIQVILEHKGSGIYDHIDSLVQSGYGLYDIVQYGFPLFYERFRAVLKGEGEASRLLTLLQVCKKEIDRQLTIYIEPHLTAEYALKYRVLEMVEYINEKL